MITLSLVSRLTSLALACWQLQTYNDGTLEHCLMSGTMLDVQDYTVLQCTFSKELKATPRTNQDYVNNCIQKQN